MKLATLTAATLLVLCHFAAALPSDTLQLKDKYKFSANLDGEGMYDLFWNFDLDTEEISFAVRVNTTGWVGFGLSPNGQMPGSDVVIGWVDDSGTVSFDDRYAEGRFLPPVDTSQDWKLLSGTEDNGATILEFTRKFITCDERDLDIEPETARVVWSWHSEDPTAPDLITQHQFQGSFSLNLLGGLNEDRQIPPDTKTFTINVENVTLPHEVDTTYWCIGHQLPEEIRQKEGYIYKNAPFISDAGKPFAHHMVIYLCNSFDPDHLDIGSHCDDATVSVKLCRGSTVLATWAVGGEDFVYPDGVAQPIGGGRQQYVVLEMHYDNPTFTEGVIDSSGMEFSYTSTPPENLAGVLSVGTIPSADMIIPPNAERYVTTATCSKTCTNQLFPPEGITVFGSFLHTHLLGNGLIVHHLRQNEQCGLLEELPPIDSNLKYDFNYQQSNLLSEEVKILPGDTVLLECFYRSKGTSRTGATLGGESTQQEMCFSFLLYYPLVDLSFCFTQPLPTTFDSFVDNHIPTSKHQDFYQGLERDPVTFLQNKTLVESALDEVDWTQETIQELQDTIDNGDMVTSCTSPNPDGLSYIIAPIPKIDCPYQKPDSCAGTQSPPVTGCCPTDPTDPTEGAHTTIASTILIAITAIMSVLHM